MVERVSRARTDTLGRRVATRSLCDGQEKKGQGSRKRQDEQDEGQRVQKDSCALIRAGAKVRHATRDDAESSGSRN